jgi:hypothetical protein
MTTQGKLIINLAKQAPQVNQALQSPIELLPTKLEELLQITSPTEKQHNPELAIIPTGASITKDIRHTLFGGKQMGGAESMKPENWQRETIEKYTRTLCNKTSTRINLRTHKLENIKNPNTKANGFDYSEDFDGCQIIPNQHTDTIYINLKCIVGQGGAQTRSLREVYWFIEGQLQTLINQLGQQEPTTTQQHSEPGSTNNIYFANILDGDCCHKYMPQFNYLLNLPEYLAVKNKIYIGDLHTYCYSWWPQKFKPNSVETLDVAVAVE